MLTPSIITIVYWLMLIGSVFSGFAASNSMIFMGVGGPGRLLTGIFVTICGAIGSRIACELLIVLFKIYDNTKFMTEKKHAEIR